MLIKVKSTLNYTITMKYFNVCSSETLRDEDILKFQTTKSLSFLSIGNVICTRKYLVERGGYVSNPRILRFREELVLMAY